jgi:hypothetical protein
MCYTSTDSIVAYIINLTTSIYLYKNAKNEDYKIIAFFFLFVGQMQLFDYLLWKNTSCNLTNKIVTKFAIIFNHLQPVALYLLVRYYKKTYKKENRITKYSKLIILIYLLVIIPYTTNLWQSNNCTINDSVCCTLPFKKENDLTVLDWQWNTKKFSNSVYFIFVLALVINSLEIQTNNIVLIGILLITLGSAAKISIFNKSIGRGWCYFASLCPLLFLVLNHYNVNLNINL